MKNLVFQINQKVLMAMLLTLSLAFTTLAQDITVKGTVYDSAGEPLIGASVIPEGTTSGTATDYDGNFDLSVKPNATLVVSYVGFETQRVAVNGRTDIKITLKTSGIRLDEVVAIGYGTVKKNDATGSVSTVKPSEVEAGLAKSVQDLLVGQSPGVVVTTTAGPEGSGNIRIRGGSSLNASNDPLIVVDGVPLDNTSVQGMGNPLSMIAPDNVESMTVLKDASATAIYGSRASNGVIIITTKKGKSGKPQINFSTNMYINTARKTWKVLDAAEYANVIKNYWGTSDPSAVAALGSSKTDWQKEVLRTTFSSDYNLSVGGTAGVVPYRVSLTYTNNNGILRKSQMDRLTFGFSLTPKFFDNHLSVNANAKGYYLRNQFSDAGAVGAAIASDPTRPVFTDYNMAQGSWGNMWNGYTTWMNAGSMNINSTQNALSIIDDRENTANVWRSNGNLQLDYSLHFFPDLHLNLNLGYDVSKSDEHNIVVQNSPTAWRNTNKKGAGYDFMQHQEKSNTLLDFYANYKKDIEDISSNIDLTGGYSWQRFSANGWNNGTIYTTSGFYSPTVNNGVYNLTVDPATESLIGTRFTTVTDTNASKDGAYYWKNHLQLLSFFGRLNYTFMERYLLTVTVRGDASSRFSKDNRWGTFPSVALGWKIADEPFMESVRDKMNEMKLRLGWGITGQQDIGSYFPYLPIYQIATQGSYYPYLDGRTENGNVVYGPTLYPLGYNPNLKWERTTTWNAGLDFGFLNNRITASLDYYYRKTKDLLSFVTVPPGSATSNMLDQNIGSLENKGIEFSITARPIVTDNLTWTVNYNIAWNKNEITNLNNSDSYVQVGYISGGTGNTVQVHAVGHPAFSYYLYQQVYDNDGFPIEGAYVDQNNDGKIDDSDKVIKHSRDPQVTMTFGTTLNYKNWDFGFNLRASIGNYVYADALSIKSSLKDTWINSNLSNLIKSDFYFDGTGTSNLYMSDYWLRNASYLRCENITLGYTFKDLIDSNLKLRLYGAVQNPFIITKYNGIDPEVFDGIDRNVYPRPITFSIGAIATF